MRRAGIGVYRGKPISLQRRSFGDDRVVAHREPPLPDDEHRPDGSRSQVLRPATVWFRYQRLLGASRPLDPWAVATGRSGTLRPVASRGDSWASSDAIRRTMLGCRRRDTRPEKVLRSAVHRLGLRFRVCIRPIPEVRRTADIVFTRVRLAVFLDGCFWHGCPEHYVQPKTNTGYWSEKIPETGNGTVIATVSWLMLVGPYCGSGSMLTRLRPQRQCTRQSSASGNQIRATSPMLLRPS
jgi:DNA mismatch endonuclease Vsr